MAGPVSYMGLYSDEARSSCSAYILAPYVMVPVWHWVLAGENGLMCTEFMIELPAWCLNIGTTMNSDHATVTGDPLSLATGVQICFDECQTGWVWTCQLSILPTAAGIPDMINIKPRPGNEGVQVNTCEEGNPVEPAVVYNNFCLNQDCWHIYNPPLLTGVEIISPSCLKAHFTTWFYDWGRTYKDQLRFFRADMPEDSIIVAAATKIYTEDHSSKLLVHLDSPMETGVQYELSAYMCAEYQGCGYSTWPVTLVESYAGMADLAVTYMVNYETENFGSIGSNACDLTVFDLRVNNTGTVDSGPFSIGIFAESIEIPGSGAYIDTIYCPNIPAGSIIYETVSVSMPEGILTYHNDMSVVADIFGEVDEWSEANNKLSVGFTHNNPEIISITDVPDDFGGWVDIAFRASFHEIEYQQETDFYAILRRDPVTLEWEPVATIDAIGDTFYTVAAPTLVDYSEGGGDYLSEFMVRILSGHYIYSCPKSGFSIDNMVIVAVALEEKSIIFDGSSIRLDWKVSTGGGEDLHFAASRSRSGSPFEVMTSALISRSEDGYSLLDPDVLPGEEYSYRIEYSCGEETRLLFESETVEIPAMPLALDQNRPNPFNPSTEIAYYLPSSGPVSIEIFDVAGRQVRMLVKGAQPSGRYTVEWNGRDDSGAPVASGIYFYRLRAGKETLTRKMVLLR